MRQLLTGRLRDTRDHVIYWLRVDGLTFREIGELFGISGNRAMQIVQREQRRRTRERTHA
jgi:DNA-directed RNA polymerase specialized sigma24 family protein